MLPDSVQQLQQQLHALGIDMETIQQHSLCPSLQHMADLASTLGSHDVSPAWLLTTITYNVLLHQQLGSINEHLQRHTQHLEQQCQALETLLQQLDAQVADTDVRHTQQQATVLALQGDLTGYEAKCQEYTTQLQDITNRLQAAGVTDQVTHSGLLSRRDQYMQRQEELEDVTKQLDVFCGLPMELHKAEDAYRAKRAEHQALLQRLQEELVTL